MTFNPKYIITTSIAQALSSIEASRQLFIELPITAKVIASLRHTARIASTHNSTYIEGNRLTIAEVREVIEDGGHFPNKEKDEIEVRNYYQALDYLDSLSKNTNVLQEDDIKTLHGLSFFGKTTPTPYRDGQNVIRAGKLVVYIPPKAEDVPELMREMVKWINRMVIENCPVPIIAGLAHYQFATIHPYYDGNGRTARLLATLVLHKYGYGLKGIYSLEEYYASDLEAYYNALTVGLDEDYYEGKRAEGNLTNFLNYFIHGMACSFEKIKSTAKKAKGMGDIDQSPLLRDLTNQQKQTLNLFLSSKEVSAKDLAKFFKLSDRQARHLCQKWVLDRFIEISNPAPKSRNYKLNEKYESLVVSHIQNRQ